MPASLFARIKSELNAARKSQDKPRTLLLSTLLSDAKNKEIELGRELADDDVVDVVRRGIKRRRESVDMYEKGGRIELATSERAEVAILETFLPAAVGDDELRAAVRAAIAGGAGNIGAVMGAVMKQFKGRAEGGTINRIAKEELAKQ
jgi:uncharacterized protein YqeY